MKKVSDRAKRAFAVVAMSITVTACDAISEAGANLATFFGVPSPSVWALANGHRVIVDGSGKSLAIVGTDYCNTGFGSVYACWRFSLKPDSANAVLLSDGSRESWLTVDEGSGRVSLQRPNGFKVISVD